MGLNSTITGGGLCEASLNKNVTTVPRIVAR